MSADGLPTWLSSLVVPVGDAGALAAAVALLLDDPDFADRLGTAAREIAGRDFRWSDFVDAYETLFERIVTL